MNLTAQMENKKSQITSNYKNNFIDEYKKLRCKHIKAAKSLHLSLLVAIKKAIKDDSYLNFKNYIDILNSIGELESHTDLQSVCEDNDYPLKETNVLIFACRYNRTNIVKHILNNFSIMSNVLLLGLNKIMPNDRDDFSHTAFYYAIVHSNQEILKLLIDMWPGKYFAANYCELEMILSKTYEEIKVRNIYLTKEMEIFIEEKILDYRFILTESTKDQDSMKLQISLENIKERINILLNSISSLHSYEKVNDIFIFTARFIAHNIFILKQQLKSTYSKLPWEEIEFCLVSYILNQAKETDIYLFCKIILNKTKILKYLSMFKTKLEKFINEDLNNLKLDTLNVPPKLCGDKNIRVFIEESLEFQELHTDCYILRNIISLETINNYTKIIVHAGFNNKIGPIILLKSMTTIGEYLKDTLESPKLAKILSEIILLTLPKKTRDIYITLRNMPSYTHLQSKKLEYDLIENNYFSSIKNDTRRMKNIITYLLYNMKTQLIKSVLERFIDSHDINVLREISICYNEFKLNDVKAENFNSIMYKTIKKIVEELEKNVIERDAQQECLIKEISENIASEEKHLTKFTDLSTAPLTLGKLNLSLLESNTDHSDIKLAKYYAKNILKNLYISEKLFEFLKNIAEIAVNLYCSCLSKIRCQNLDEIDRLTCLLVDLANIEAETNEWANQMEEKINRTFIDERMKVSYIAVGFDPNVEFSLKVCQLQSLFKAIEPLNTNYKKCNTVFLKAIEITMQDILSIVNSTSNQESDIFWIDKYSPVLFGRSLLNYLAYNTTIIYNLLLDPMVSVLISGKKIITEEFTLIKKNMCAVAKEDIPALKERYNEGLLILSKQEKMFTVLSGENEDLLKNCLTEGADINGRNKDLQTLLHIAAKSSNLEMVKFLLNTCLTTNCEDINKQSPLHIAALHCRASIVELFVQLKSFPIDGVDIQGRTALHYAANAGDVEIINILLKHKANVHLKDNEGLTPLHYTILNNRLEAFKIFIFQDKDVKNKDISSGLTLLHLAASRDCLDIMNILLKLKANVNAVTETNCTPLHLAAVKGYVEGIKLLISQGANVNAKDSSGNVPLHYAVEQGHVETVKTLLAAGAKVDLQNKKGNTALHIAVKAGASEIVDVILESKADVLLADTFGDNAVHFAIQSGDLKILRTLLKTNPQVLLKQENLLVTALEYNKREIMEYLIKKGVSLETRGKERHAPVHWAAANYCHKKILELLLERKVDLNTKDFEGTTPLHSAVASNELEIVKFLVANGADVNAKSDCNATPLHVAAKRGHLEIVNFLIESGAEVDVATSYLVTPLHWAADTGYPDVLAVLLKKTKQIDARDDKHRTALFYAVENRRERALELLIAKEAELNVVDKKGVSALGFAVANNYENIAKILIGSGADVDIQAGQPLLWAILHDNEHLVQILLDSRASLNFGYDEKRLSLLHIAVMRNLLNTAEMLISKGLWVNIEDGEGNTPLHTAVEVDNEQAVKMLLKRGANVNALNNYRMSPLHLASAEKHERILNAILQAAPDFDSKNFGESTPLEQAVILGHVKTAKLLLSRMRSKKENCVNQSTDYQAQRLLHLAAQTGNLDMVQMLMENGADIRAKDRDGHLAIHHAATRNCKELVEHFLDASVSVDEPGPRGKTPLHFAAMAGQKEVAELLLSRGAKLNVQDWSGVSPIHLAAFYGHHDMVKMFAHRGGQYKMRDNFGRKLEDACTKKLLRSNVRETETLFEMIKQNNTEAVKKHVRDGAMINAIGDEDEATPLTLAVITGFDEIVSLLLHLKADPNFPDGKGRMPLHYAAELSNPKIVKILLANGAIYNPLCKTGRTPVEITKNKSIATLLRTIDDCFHGVGNDSSKFFIELKKIKNFDTIQAIVGSVNRDKHSLFYHAFLTNYSKLDQLNSLWEDPILNDLLTKAEQWFDKGSYSNALSIYMKAFVMRKDMLGPRHPATLEIQYQMGVCLHNLNRFDDAAKLLEETYQSQKNVMLPGSKTALKSRNGVVMTLLKQNKVKEAREAIEELLVLPEKKFCETEILISRYYMALIFEKEQKRDIALRMLTDVLASQKEKLGETNAATKNTEAKYRELLSQEKKTIDELRNQWREYLKNKKNLGTMHDETCKSGEVLFQMLFSQKKYDEAMELLEDRYESETERLGVNSAKSLQTKSNMALIHVKRGQLQDALKLCRECREVLARQKGRGHQDLHDCDILIGDVVKRLQSTGVLDRVGIVHIERLKEAIMSNDEAKVKELLEQNSEVNTKDVEGITLLHYAADMSLPRIVKLLLDCGAMVGLASDKGTTSLHIAAMRGNDDVMEILLEHIKNQAPKTSGLVNTQSRIRGNAALHIAAKCGNYGTVKNLLKYSAIYNIRNDDNKTPVDMARESSDNIIRLLRLVAAAFQNAKKGDEKMVAALEAAKPDEVEAILNAHNREHKTVIQVAIMNKHNALASKLLKIIQKPS